MSPAISFNLLTCTGPLKTIKVISRIVGRKKSPEFSIMLKFLNNVISFFKITCKTITTIYREII